MIIRQGRAEDVSAAMAIVRRVVPLMRDAGNLQWDDVYPNHEAFAQDVELARLWVAELDGRVAGVSAVTMEQDPEYADVGWDLTEPAIVMHRLAVDPDLTGKGIAKALMLNAEDVARSRGLHILRVDTNSENPTMQRILLGLGYNFAGEIGLAFRPGLRFYCYEKRLS